tara:strand:- start:2660 stop:3091 length:432 start_codon:yes stop_codon:yes gene_type:complete
MARRQQVEASLQIAIVGWLHDVLPASVVHHSPNGGDRKPWYVERLKNMGMRPGWPDLELLVPDDAFVHPVDVAPIFLEVKTRTGRLSEAQQSLHSDLSRFKVHLYTVKSIDDCRNALTGLVTLRPATPHGKIIEEQAKILAGS